MRKNPKRIQGQRYGTKTQTFDAIDGKRKYKIDPGTVGEYYTVIVDDVLRDPMTVTVSDFNEIVFLNAVPSAGSRIKVIF